MSQNSLIVIKSNVIAEDGRYLGEHVFSARGQVLVYEVTELSAFNQLLGYAKYCNNE